MAKKNNTNTLQPAANSNQSKLEKGVTTCVQLHEMPVGAGIGEIVIYNPNDSIQLEVRMEQESVWLSQTQMGTLFGVDRTVIVKHIKNVYECGELDMRATCAKIARVQKEASRIREVFLVILSHLSSFFGTTPGANDKYPSISINSRDGAIKQSDNQ